MLRFGLTNLTGLGASKSPRLPTPPLDGMANVTGAWSAARKLLTTYSGPFTTGPSSAVTHLHDQSGAARDFQQPISGQPTLETASPNNRACLNFDGTQIMWSSAAEDLVALGDKYIAVSFIPNAITRNEASPELNNVILIDEGEYFGLLMKNTGENFDSLVVYNFDTEEDHVLIVGLEVGTPFLAEFRQEGGTLYGRLNMDTWVSIASGNTGSLTNAMQLAKGQGTVNRGNLKIFELVTRDIAGSSAEQDAIAASMMAHVGAVALAGVPVNTGLPVITGDDEVNATSTLSDGVWTGNPSGFLKQRKRDGAEIPGATVDAYNYVEADIGTMHSGEVIAVNEFGNSLPAESAAVGPIEGVAPANTVLPTITGTLEVGVSYTIETGSWDGIPAPTFEGELLNAANNAVLATGLSGVFSPAWEGLNVKPRVYATNVEQSDVVATGNSVGPIAAATDVTAPVLSNLVIDEITETTANVAFDSDEGGTFWGVVYPATAAEPVAAQIEAGTDGDDDPAVWDDSFAVAGAASQGGGITGLTLGTGYKFSGFVRDAAGNTSSVITGAFSTAGAAVLSNIVATPGADDRWGELSVDTDTPATGTTYWVVVPTAATAPSAAQIKAGQDGSGAAATFAGSSASPAATQTKRATGLTHSTTYDAYAVQETGAGFSNVVTDEFTTDVLVKSAVTDGTATSITASTGSAAFATAQGDADGGSNAIGWTDINDAATNQVVAQVTSVTFFQGVNRFRLKTRAVSSAAAAMWLRLVPANVTQSLNAHFDITNGIVGGTESWIGTPTITSLGGGWWQIDGTLDMTGADVTGAFNFLMGDANNDATVVRNGTNTVRLYDFRITRAS